MPTHRLEVPAPHILPFAIGSFDSIGRLSRAAFPHRHTFHEIVYVTGGSGSHVIDLSRWPLDPPHLSFVAPGQIHFWERAIGLSGWVVLFDDAFLLAHPGDRDLLRLLTERPWLCPDEEEAAGILPVLAEMLREYRAQRPGMISVLQAYLHVLVVRAARLPRPGTEPGEVRVLPPGAAAGRAAALAQRFARQLALSRPRSSAERPVSVWAAELGVSVSYLNEAVRRTTGHTPARLIRQAQVLEAKRLLASTGLTVSRVAHEVGFSDAAYFCRFFRRETGTTPGEFRRASTGGMHHGHRTLSIEAHGATP
ncbi:helix-turn-helix transcriptional regulator [Streptomyces daliensis]